MISFLPVSNSDLLILCTVAEGASNSAVVIVCVSPSYETSQNCELEANYIHGHRIPHIHVMIEKIYRPPSWYVFKSLSLLSPSFFLRIMCF